MGSILNVLVSPKLTFEKIRENGGAFVIPFIVLLVGTLIAVFLQIPVIEAQFDKMEPQPGVDLEAVKSVGIIFGVISAPIFVAISVFFIALLLMLVNMIVRGEAKYMSLVKVSVLAQFPALISALLLGVLAQTMDPDTASGIKFSLAALMENGTGFVHGLLNLINPFGLWGLAIMVIGSAAMMRKSGKQVAVWIIGGWIVISSIFLVIGGSIS